MIEEFIQGKDDDGDHKLFGLLGAWLTSRKVHQSLGMPVTSDAGDVWHLMSEGGKACGFALTHYPKLGRPPHIRYLFGEGDGVQQRLLDAVLATARDRGVTLVYTLDRKSAEIWPRNGFSLLEYRGRREFCRWNKEIGEKS